MQKVFFSIFFVLALASAFAFVQSVYLLQQYSPKTLIKNAEYDPRPIIDPPHGVIGPSPSVKEGKAYALMVNAPNSLINSDEARVDVIVTNIKTTASDEEWNISIEILSDQCNVTPTGWQTVPLIEQKGASFIISCKDPGKKQLLVRSKLNGVAWFNESKPVSGPRIGFLRMPGLPAMKVPVGYVESEYPLTIDVRESSVWFGFSKSYLDGLKTISAVIGLPSLILLFVQLLIKKRTE